MELANAQHDKKVKQRKQRKKRRWVLGKLFAWFDQLVTQSGVGPFITLSSLVAAIVAVIVTTYHFETDALTKQLSEDRAKYEDSLSKIQTEIKSRIPDSVRSPLPIFPENGQTLLLKSTGETTLELEWADRDREHRHRYIVQLVCFAKISEQGSSEESRCHTDKLDEDKLDEDTRDREKPDSEKNYHWTLPGMDRHIVEIKDAGTYAWRVARGEINGNGDITIFEKWSQYFIFTVFKSSEQRIKIMKEVRVGVVDDRKLKTIEEKIVDLAEKMFKEEFEKKSEIKPTRYSRYATYEALVEGVLRGEVDYAIGEITRAKYREKRGVFFTQGYAPALPTFISKQSETRPPRDGDTIGVVLGSISDRALAHLAKSKKFAIVKELTLDALLDDLRSGSVHFIFTERERPDHLASSSTSTGQEEFVSAGTLYGELKDFYDDQLGYSAMHAIATAGEALCKRLNEQVEKEYKQDPYNKVVRRIHTIYREEGETFFNVSLYLRAVDLFFPGTEQSCVKS
ncbi:MAG: transporter substrate-binding domain-containing protein [Nitrospira sp.]|nr:transporter substrate-binding domain-containing protein [Nitrospira sp.]